MQELKGEVQVLKEDVYELKEDVAELKGRVQHLEEDMHELKGEVQILKEDVHQINLHVENVTDVNIQRVAEGHIDLRRVLLEAVEVSKRDELRDVRINMLEADVRKIKAKLQMCPA